MHIDITEANIESGKLKCVETPVCNYCQIDMADLFLLFWPRFQSKNRDVWSPLHIPIEKSELHRFTEQKAREIVGDIHNRRIEIIKEFQDRYDLANYSHSGDSVKDYYQYYDKDFYKIYRKKTEKEVERIVTKYWKYYAEDHV